MRIDGFNLVQAGSATSISDILSKLKVGDILRAQVLDIAADEAILKLFDGTTVAAATLGSVDAKQGDFVDFSVKGFPDGKLLLQTLKQPMPVFNENEAIANTILSLGISPDNDSINIAKELNAAGLPLTKENMDKASQLLSNFKASGITPEKAVYILKNNIPPVENNLSSLQQLTDENYKITSSIRDIIDNMPEIKDQRLLQAITKGLERTDAKYNPAASPIADELTSVQQNANPSDTSVKINAKELLQNIITQLSDKITSNNTEALRQFLNNSSFAQKLQNFIASQPANKMDAEKIIDFIKTQLKDIPEQPEKKQFMQSIFKELDKLNKNELLNANNNSIEDTKKHINKLFSKALLDVEAGDLTQGAVKNSYKELYEKLDVIKQEIAASTYPLKEQFTDKLDNIQNNLRFMNEASNYAAYLQIPVSLKGSDKTVELYILKREGSKKKLDPENMTVFVSLDTQNLGRVDSLISVSRKSVMINFKLEDKKLSEAFSSNYNELFNSLEEIGFKLVGMNFGLIKDKINLVNAQKVIKREIGSNRISIDYKI